MKERPPVQDWTTDLDHMDPRWARDPFPIWDELRESCPIAHTERYGGVYLPTRMADVRDIAYDTEHFSSRRVVMRENPPNVPLPSPPITSDPPHHRPSRMLLLPAFTPQAIEPFRAVTRRIANELLDQIGDAKRSRRRRRIRAAHPGARHRQHAGPARITKATASASWIHIFLEDTIRDDAGQRRPPRRHRQRDERLFPAVRRRAPQGTGNGPDQLPDQGRVQRPGADRTPFLRHASTAADRRHRHHLERHRIVALASRQDAGRPPTPGRRSRPDPDRGRGVPARLCAGHDGAPGGERYHGRRLPDAQGRADPAGLSRPPTAIPQRSPIPTR